MTDALLQDLRYSARVLLRAPGFSLVVIASVVMGYFHGTIKREAAAWEAAGAVSSRGVKFAVAACLLWAAVTIGGRLTAYLGSLYA